MSDDPIWLLGCATDRAPEVPYDTALTVVNSNVYPDIRDGSPDPRLWRRAAPAFRASEGDVFPDIVLTTVLPSLWSRRMVAALLAVAPEPGCLILPADISLKGKRLPWSHSLVVPLHRVRGAVDLGCSEGEIDRRGRTLLRPRRVVLRSGWRPPAPVFELAELAIDHCRNALAVTRPVAKALGALDLHGVGLLPLSGIRPDAMPARDGRITAAAMAAWMAAERGRRGNDRRPMIAAEAADQLWRAAKAAKTGLRLGPGEVIRWDGSRFVTEAGAALEPMAVYDRLVARAAALAGIRDWDHGRGPYEPAVAAFRAWLRAEGRP